MYFIILFNVLVKTVHQMYNFNTGIGQNVNIGASPIITNKCSKSKSCNALSFRKDFD